ncbi:MAG: hypothetical protein JO226_22005 [Pluralibacter sp.]|nr:hypothetical protein [Pluralibacter sp.]
MVEIYSEPQIFLRAVFLLQTLQRLFCLNGSGVRDTVRTLKVGINTVIRTLKNSRQNK